MLIDVNVVERRLDWLARDRAQTTFKAGKNFGCHTIRQAPTRLLSGAIEEPEVIKKILSHLGLPPKERDDASKPE
jgi:hypothetical protein